MHVGQRIKDMDGSQKLGSGLVGPLPAVSFCLVCVLDLGRAAVKRVKMWELAEVSCGVARTTSRDLITLGECAKKIPPRC